MTTAPDAEPPGWGLGEVDHVGIAVADLDVAIRFHTEVLGLRLTHREDNAEQGVAEAMLQPRDPGHTQVQLVAPLVADSPVGRFLDRRGPGLHHVAYAVADLVTASQVLRHRGVRLLYDSPRAGTRGSLINFVHPADTGGVLVELVQPSGGQRRG